MDIPESQDPTFGRKQPDPGAPRALSREDIPHLVALEKICFTVPWTAKQYQTIFGHEAFKVYGLTNGSDLVAYVTLFASSWEMEVLNLAVRPDQRRRGHARRLLGHVLHLCGKMGIKRGYLEVRRSNVAALNLYAAFGFAQVGVRKAYYPDNREDAIVMRLDFEPDQA